MTSSAKAYHPAQIILHWFVVLGILVQWIFNEQIIRTVATIQTGGTPANSDMIMAWVHVGTGSMILLAVIARLALLYRFSKPDHAAGTPKVQAAIATWTHRALYATLFAMVITGGLKWNGVAAVGDLHFYFNILLFALAAAHALAALYNQFVRKDGTMNRMMLHRNR